MMEQGGGIPIVLWMRCKISHEIHAASTNFGMSGSLGLATGYWQKTSQLGIRGDANTYTTGGRWCGIKFQRW